MYIPRYSERQAEKISQTFKILYMAGPRQTGKTTLLRHLAQNSQRSYVTLDDLPARQMAQTDPKLFLQEHPAPLLIDEVQYAPQLFPYLKIAVDNQDQKGQYWLTGSQQFSLMRNVQESLAGRVGIMNLLGLSLAELQQIPDAGMPFVPGTIPDQPSFLLSPQEIFDAMVRGFFPALQVPTAPDVSTFYSSYIQTYIDRDVQGLFGVTKTQAFHRFLQLCAARTGQMLNYSDLARDADISVHAAREWLDILVTTMQVLLLQPYYPNLSRRMIKAPKLYFLDTGLAAHLAGWRSGSALREGAMAGAFLETFVVSELMKSFLFRGQEPPLFYFRDKEGHEVDILIERDGRLHPIEVKLKATILPEDVPALAYFRQKAKDKAGPGAVVCLTSESYALDRTTRVIPVTAIV